jgi:hypothetical protein
MMAGPSPSMDYTTRTAYQAGAGSQHANTGDLVTNGLEGMGDSGLAMMASTSPSVSDGAEDFVFQGVTAISGIWMSRIHRHRLAAGDEGRYQPEHQ